jgi:DNA-binding LytR/AlgR family response regulator
MVMMMPRFAVCDAFAVEAFDYLVKPPDSARLRRTLEDLERRRSPETDEAKARDLERQLAQVDSELSQKDNDACRRRHTKFTKG